MRADRNPTRTRHIPRLAKRLAARLTRRCPDCGTPGYGAVAAERGLPCAAWRPRYDGLRATDPAHCARCNP